MDNALYILLGCKVSRSKTAAFNPPILQPKPSLLLHIENPKLEQCLQKNAQHRENSTPSTLEHNPLTKPNSLRLGSTAPNFQADTTTGPIDFHSFTGSSWVVLFSHPEDYTPVCTTELGAFAKLEPEFTKRSVKLIGLSANTIDSHSGWIKDINEISGANLKFPIIGDKERKVAYLYDMLDHQDVTNVDQKGIAFTIRSVFVIDPKKTIRLILSYPASTGRNTAEVLRVVDSLQTGDKQRVTTPINWVPGEFLVLGMLW